MMVLASMVPLLFAPQGPGIDRDIVYKTVNGQELKLDAYRPTKSIGKIFIAIHGGGFTGGEKGGNTATICRYLSSRGFTCFDIDYRLQRDVGGSIQNAINAAVDDTLSAYTWVTKNARNYGGDSTRIAIGGSSAGAITSLYAAYSRRLSVKAVVDLWGGMYGKESDIKKDDPALLIVHGRNDKSVSYSLAEALNNQARKVGLRVRFLSNNGGHSLDLNTEIDHYTILQHIESFLRETM